MKIPKKEQFVFHTILNNPGIQDNDDKLIAAVWRRQGWDDGRSLEDNISRVMRPETITRARRKLHERGLIVYSVEADKMREEAYKKARDEHSNYNPGKFF